MHLFILILAVPLVWALIARIFFLSKFTWKEFIVQVGVSFLFSGFLFAGALYSKTLDNEFIHGQITDKVRDEGSYEESYSCNCRSVCRGTGNNRICQRVCDTCYRTIYTVHWYLESTLGRIDIDRKSSQSRSVWMATDPLLYTESYIGEPCTKMHYYENYVLAAKRSLFNREGYSYTTKFPLPNYPRLYSIYRSRNAIGTAPGVTAEVLDEWNTSLRDKLKILGPKKQANIIIVFTEDPDPKYRYALEKHWMGGKKNDIVIIFGTARYPDLAWVDVFTFALSAGNHEMIVALKDDLVGKGKLNAQEAIEIIASHVDKSFKRKQMADLEYLADDIAPTTGAVIGILVAQLVVSVLLTFYFVRNECFEDS